MPTPQPLVYELCFHKVAATHNRTAAKFSDAEFTIHPERLKRLADEPYGFEPLRGDFPKVNAAANRLNDVQLRSGILDYFFFPEAVPVGYDRTHCPACMRIAARDALED